MRERKREEAGNGVLQLCRIKGYVSEHMGGGRVSILVWVCVCVCVGGCVCDYTVNNHSLVDHPWQQHMSHLEEGEGGRRDPDCHL